MKKLDLKLISECADTNDWRPLDTTVGEVVKDLIDVIHNLDYEMRDMLDQKPASTLLVEEMSVMLNLVDKSLQDVLILDDSDDDLTVIEKVESLIANYKNLKDDYQNLTIDYENLMAQLDDHLKPFDAASAKSVSVDIDNSDDLVVKE